MALNNEHKIELLSQRISILRAALESETSDLAELKKIDHPKVSMVEADLLDRVASIEALNQEILNLG